MATGRGGDCCSWRHVRFLAVILLNPAPPGRVKIHPSAFGRYCGKLAALASATCLSGRRPRSIRYNFEFQRELCAVQLVTFRQKWLPNSDTNQDTLTSESSPEDRDVNSRPEEFNKWAQAQVFTQGFIFISQALDVVALVVLLMPYMGKKHIIQLLT